MTAENISWSLSTKECCPPRRGLNPRPPGLQSDGASNWATEASERDKSQETHKGRRVQSDIQRHEFEQKLFSQQLWLIVLLIFIKTTLYSKSTFPLKHFKCNINIVYTAQTESSKTKISLFWNEKKILLVLSFISWYKWSSHIWNVLLNCKLSSPRILLQEPITG